MKRKARSDGDLLTEVFNRLADSPIRCYDAETSGLDWKRNHVVGHVVTFGPAPQDSYYLPVRHKAGGNLFGNAGPQDAEGWDGDLTKLPGWESDLIRELDQPGTTMFGHNLGFDLKFMWRLGGRLNAKYQDTSINAPLIDEFQAKYSLAYCATIAKVEAKKVDEIKKHIQTLFPEATDKDYMGHFWRLAGNDPKAVEYAAGDGTTTWQLRDWQNVQITDQELGRVWDVECRLIPVLARMTIKGVKIDEERLDWVIKDLNARIDRLLSEFPAEFNPKSPTDVEKWCRDNGQTDWPLTQKTKKPSFPESWLSTHEPGQKIVAIRRWRTLLNSFMTPMLERHMFNGRVHSEFHQLRSDEYGTVTGRLSSSEPNLQQASKRNVEIGRIHRSIFIPDEGMLWGSDDYSQCEPRLLAYYSGCKALMDGYNSTPEVDAHTAATAKMYHKQWEVADAKEQKALRERGKRVNQTLITGGGPGVIVERYGVDRSEAQQLFEDYFKAMPEVKQLQWDAAYWYKRRGYVKSLLGRRARLDNPSYSYRAVNRLLQCGNADIIKLKMVEIDDYLASVGRPIDMLINIHDAIESQFRPEDRKHRDEMLRIMQDFGPNCMIHIPSLPIRVEPGEGKNWAEATFGEEKK